MRERLNPALRILCLVLAGVIVLQLSRLALGKNPVADLALPEAPPPATNSVAPVASVTPTPKTETNSPPRSRKSGRDVEVPAAIQPRVERITQSEILAPVIRPQPMALLGIGGLDAFLRTPDGRPVLLRVGGEAGGVKLLQIGTNRVLIEHDGQKKELTLFSGLGGEAVLTNDPPKLP